jgi:hypothetical protein
MRHRRFRFSLTSLLIVSTAIVLFLGYSQWRRQLILRRVDELTTRTYASVEVPNNWIDLVWQRRPISSHVYVYSPEWKVTCDELGIKKIEWQGNR